MNLTMIFLVLSVAIGYMLYDTFKKSRNTTSQQNQPTSSRIKTNYASQCRILKDLHQEKLNTVRARNLSIHLCEQNIVDQEKVDLADIYAIKKRVSFLNHTTRIYVVYNRNLQQKWIHKLLREVLPESQFLPFNSIEGSVAILRQLNCNIHLESDLKLFKIIKQYLNNIWFAGQDKEGAAKVCFQDEIKMLCGLQKVIQAQQLKLKEANL